jgi:hypothetical protein
MKQLRSLAGILLCIAGLFAVGRCAAAEFTAATLPLEDVIKLPDQTIDFQKSVDLILPGLPEKPGKIIVLRFKMVSFYGGIAGCSENAMVELNGTGIGRHTSSGDERIIGRSTTFEFATFYTGTIPIINDSLPPDFTVIFAPDVKTGDSATKDGMGATFTLNVSDMVRGVDGNTLTIRNIRVRSGAATCYDLIVRDIEVGWADKAMLPKPPHNAVPTRGTISAAVSAGSIRLALGNAGGFTVARTGGPEVMVETALSMSRDVPSGLLADDSLPKAGLSVTREAFGPAGYRVTAVWPKVKLVRTVEIRGNLVEWKERWTNTGSAILGIPFRHRIFLRDGDPRFILGGDPDLDALECGSMNPTLYVESRDHGGCGCGVMMESDWLRLLSSLRYGRGNLFRRHGPRPAVQLRLLLHSHSGGLRWVLDVHQQRPQTLGDQSDRPVCARFPRLRVCDHRENARRQHAQGFGTSRPGDCDAGRPSVAVLGRP